MILANDLREGDFIKVDGKIFRVTDMEKRKPGKGHALVLGHMMCISSHKSCPYRFVSSDKVDKIFIEIKKVHYLYDEGNIWIFQDDNGEEFDLKKNPEDHKEIFIPYCEKIGLVFNSDDNEFLYYDYPAHCEITVTETSDPSHGSHNTNHHTKPAVLENGITIHVPNYLHSGQKIKMDIRDLKFLEKAEPSTR